MRRGKWLNVTLFWHILIKIRQFKGTAGVRCKKVLSACILERTSECCLHVLSPIGYDQVSMINNISGHQHCLVFSTHQHPCLDRAADWGRWKPMSLCCLVALLSPMSPNKCGPQKRRMEQWVNAKFLIPYSNVHQVAIYYIAILGQY